MRGGIGFKKIRNSIIVHGFMPLAIVLLSALPALAGGISPATSAGTCGQDTTIGGVLCNVFENSTESVGLLAGMSYLFGLVIGLWAIAKFYEHVQNPHQVSIWEPLKRTICAGCLFALPMVMEVVYVTLSNNSGDALTLSSDSWAGSPTGAGLDAMVVALMNDAYKPFANVVKLFCYMAATILTIIGILRLLKSAQEGPRGPGGFGTIMTFIVAGALFSADEMMSAWSTTLFTTDQVANQAQLTFDAGLTDPEREHVLSVISAVLAFVMVLGWVSFVRGWFIIRDVAEGNQQASLMAGMTHLFGGALAINLGPLLNAVQETFGLSAVGVNFG